MNLTKQIPNLVTYSSLVLGMVCVHLVFRGEVALAMGLNIIPALVLDQLDGFLARKLDAGSEFGKYSDITIDYSVFIVFQAIILYRLGAAPPALLAVFVACGLVRHVRCMTDEYKTRNRKNAVVSLGISSNYPPVVFSLLYFCGLLGHSALAAAFIAVLSFGMVVWTPVLPAFLNRIRYNLPFVGVFLLLLWLKPLRDLTPSPEHQASILIALFTAVLVGARLVEIVQDRRAEQAS